MVIAWQGLIQVLTIRIPPATVRYWGAVSLLGFASPILATLLLSIAPDRIALLALRNGAR
jgi:hypothetical protein